MKIINFKFIILFLCFFILSKSKYIVIPLKKYYHTYENENSISKIDSNLYYTELSIGEPSQKIIFFINSTTESNMGIKNKFCDSKFYLDDPTINQKYNYENSTTFYQISEGNMDFGKKDLLIKDQFSFYSNFELTEEIKAENITIIYNPNSEEYILDDVGMDFINDKEKRAACGYIGLRLEMNSQSINNNFLEQLKEKGIISKTIFSFIEVNKNNTKYKNNKIEYLMVIGEDIYDIFSLNDINKYINEKYKKEQYVEKTKISDYILEGYYFKWKLTMNNIYIDNNNNITNMKAITNIFIDNNYGAIAGTKEYRDIIKELFFNDYINKSKCFEKDIISYEIGGFHYIICDDDININNFPTLYLKSNNLQYVYELTKDELFLKDNNKIYFLIIFEYSKTNSWTLGKPFLEKYLLSYNYDAKSIGFYNENLLDNSHNDNNNKKYIILIVVIILSLIALVLGFLIGRYFYNKAKKKNALELDESLKNDYSSEELENKEKKDAIN